MENRRGHKDRQGRDSHLYLSRASTHRAASWTGSEVCSQQSTWLP